MTECHKALITPLNQSNWPLSQSTLTPLNVIYTRKNFDKNWTQE